MLVSRVTDPASGHRIARVTSTLKTLPMPQDKYLPLEDPATLAAYDAPTAFLTNQMDIANEQQTN
jgi:hypothetical protein